RRPHPPAAARPAARTSTPTSDYSTIDLRLPPGLNDRRTIDLEPIGRRSMQFAVTFRHMEPTDALKAYAKERMERVRKYLPDPIACHVVLSTERHNHRIDVSFQLHNGLAIAGHETTENMYSSIDLCIAKIERQVRKYKGKLEVMRARPHHVQALPWSHSIIDEAFHELNDGGNGKAVTKEEPKSRPEF